MKMYGYVIMVTVNIQIWKAREINSARQIFKGIKHTSAIQYEPLNWMSQQQNQKSKLSLMHYSMLVYAVWTIVSTSSTKKSHFFFSIRFSCIWSDFTLSVKTEAWDGIYHASTTYSKFIIHGSILWQSNQENLLFSYLQKQCVHIYQILSRHIPKQL